MATSQQAQLPSSASNDDAIEPFVEWLDGYLELRIATKRENGRWFALVEEFDIAGMGETERQAMSQVFDLLGAYLWAHFTDGKAFSETKRPIPVSLKLQIRVETRIHRLLHRAGRENRYLVPPQVLNACAA